MEDKKLEELFEDQNFDIKEPHTGHRDRFMEKLEAERKDHKSGVKIKKLWAPLVSVAALLAIAFMLFGTYFSENQKPGELAGVSPQMKKTEQFYTKMIKTELANLKAKESPATQKIVKDALNQLQKLESDYSKLEQDLRKSGKDKRVIYAMISNFQQRIDLLEKVLKQIEETKTLKTTGNENYI
ncbi:hypothetical protein SAMN05444483_101458 [Salegentibacter echinorum]|uniref:Anti-sigma factor n=1 Tax=Salegentibacter echinorum TaxID=1073325 RepID=A0A1M5CCR5_SALEC|nr:hypothetical protein [Salegentibacter echinorum]SHF52509.1 hypothetical protein SAMN05444483_101458 [Salegentibacter echinorum]